MANIKAPRLTKLNALNILFDFLFGSGNRGADASFEGRIVVTGSLSIGPVWNACIWPCFGYAFDPVGIPRNALQSIPAFALRTAYALHPSVSLGIRPAPYR